MKRYAALSLVLIALACGGQDSGESDAASAPAAQPTAPAESAPAPDPPEPVAEALEPGEAQAEGCLELVGKGEFRLALPVCIAALEANPDDERVREALDQARSETAKLADAEEAAGHAVEDAAEQAGDAARGAAEDYTP